MKTHYYLLMMTIAVLTWFPSGRGSAGMAMPADAPASLKGEVKFEGTAPKPSPIDMSQDPICAKAHPTPATTEDIVVGAGGGLANVVIYISDGLVSHTFEPPAQPVVLEQKGCQ